MSEGLFRVRFSGHCLPGFEEARVREALSLNGNFTPRQVRSIFRGHPVTLKGALPGDLATRYQVRLRRLGMDVAVEPDPGPRTAHAVESHLVPTAPAPPPEPARAVVPPVATPAPVARVPALEPKEAPFPALSAETNPAKAPTPAPAAATATTAPDHFDHFAHDPEPAPYHSHGEDDMPTPGGALPHGSHRLLERTCPRCGALVPAALPCPHCVGMTTPEAHIPATSNGPDSLADLRAKQDVSDYTTDRSSYFSLSFSGRMNTMNFLRLSCFNMLLWSISHATHLTRTLFSLPYVNYLLLIIAILSIVQAVRLSVLRLHDSGHNTLWAIGGLIVVVLAPLAGMNTLSDWMLPASVMILAALPVTERNRHGWPPRLPGGLLEWFEAGGRANRVYFLSRHLGAFNAAVVLMVVLGMACGLINLLLPDSWLFITTNAVTGALTLFACGLSVRVTIARLHDLDTSGAWLLPLYAIMALPYLLIPLGLQTVAVILMLITWVLSALAFLVLCILPGQPDKNSYGPPTLPTPTGQLWSALIIFAGITVVTLALGMVTLSKLVHF